MYLISYDLKSAQADYAAMHSAISDLGPAQRLLESTWVVDPPRGVDENQISERLHSVINPGDRYIIVHIDNRRQGWLARDMWEWMRAHDEPREGR